LLRIDTVSLCHITATRFVPRSYVRATVSAQAPPAKWWMLTPVKMAPVEERAAAATPVLALGEVGKLDRTVLAAAMR
jgi:hypothetical protein